MKNTLNPLSGMTHATVHVTITGSVTIDIKEEEKELGRKLTELDLKRIAVEKQTKMKIFETNSKILEIYDNSEKTKKGIGSY